MKYAKIVGPGGSPDENGESTIDALIMNGVTTHDIALTILFLGKIKIDSENEVLCICML